MSNLLMITPRIPSAASLVKSTHEFHADRRLKNLTSGVESIIGELATATSDSLTIQYDLGNQTQPADSLAIARADLLNVASLQLRGSDTPMYELGMLPNLEYWYDATRSVVRDGSNVVSQWTDLSGKGRHLVQPTAGNRPTFVPGGLANNFNPMIYFDGVDDWLQYSGPTLAQPLSIYIALSPVFEASKIFYAFGSYGWGDIYWRIASANGSTAMYTGALLTTPTNITQTPNVFAYTMGGGTIEGYLNGNLTSFASGASSNGMTGGLYVGRRQPSAVDIFKGYVGEILIFSAKHNATERQKVDKYLTNKWVGAPVVGQQTPLTLYNSNLALKGNLSSSLRYWWLQLNGAGGTSTSTYRHLRHALGQAIELDRNTAKIDPQVIHPNDSAFYASSGALLHHRSERPITGVEIEWHAVADAKIQEFNQCVKNKELETLFLYNTAETWQLDNRNVIHAILNSSKTERESVLNDWNTLTATFEEVR